MAGNFDVVPVLHVAAIWSEQIMTDPREDFLCTVRQGYDGLFSMTLRVPTRDGSFPLGIPVKLGEPDAVFDKEGHCLSITRWGLTRLGASVWKLTPSVIHGSFHAYVVLYDVPEDVAFKFEPPP